MKFSFQLATSALLLGWLQVANAAAIPMTQTTLADVQSQKGAVIDTRPSAFYNGWPQGVDGASGHEPQAVNLSAGWLSEMNDQQLQQWATQHQITSDRKVALYGTAAQTSTVQERLAKLGYANITLLSDALAQPKRLQRMPHFEQLVYPQWIYDLQQGKTVAAKPAGEWKVIEAAWGAPKKYLISHIPNAGYIDTNDVESEPLWNKVSDDKLKALMAKQGIKHDTTVILYGRDVYAAARVAQILLYAGVKDVRLLDGGWQTWSAAGLPVERGLPKEAKPAPDFGAAIPGQPQIMLNEEQARGLLHRKDASLVSIRSWPEFTGETSGYSYIKPKGEIAGARWGHAGSDSTHMEDFHNPDGTMRSADDIAAMWKEWHITPDQHVSSIAAPAGERQKPSCMPARWAGLPLAFTMAVGMNGAQIRRTQWLPENVGRIVAGSKS